MTSKDELKDLRSTCALAAKALNFAAKLAKEGVSGTQIDHGVTRYVIEQGAYPSGIGFMGFPAAICISPNDVLCHGVPTDRKFDSGDIVNLDLTLFKDGFFGDNSVMVEVGNVEPDLKRLVSATKNCLDEAIAICKPGTPFKAIGDIISYFNQIHRRKTKFLRRFQLHGPRNRKIPSHGPFCLPSSKLSLSYHGRRNGLHD